MIDNVKNTTSYIGNCTNKLITGLKDTFQRSRRGQGRIGFRNYAEFLWMKKNLHLLLSFFVAMSVVCPNILHLLFPGFFLICPALLFPVFNISRVKAVFLHHGHNREKSSCLYIGLYFSDLSFYLLCE